MGEKVTTQPCPLNTVAHYRDVDRWRLTPWLLGGLAVTGWLTAVVFILLWEKQLHLPKPLPTSFTSSSWDASFPNAAVSTDTWQCSEVGRRVVLDGGNAVDSALATLVCDGLVNPHSMGLGGGFFMVVFNASTSSCTTIDAREAAPSTPPSSKDSARRGWESIGVPGEVKGYWRTHKAFGSMPWRRLLQPTIDLAETGFFMELGVYKALTNPWMKRFVDKEMGSAWGASPFRMYFDRNTKAVLPVGARTKNEALGRTLEKLATSSDPDREFYYGRMANDIVTEFRNNGGKVSEADLKAYDVRFATGWTARISDDLTICTLVLIKKPPKTWDELTDAYHYMIETMKYSYGHWNYMEDNPRNKKIDLLLRDMRDPDYLRHIVEHMNKKKVWKDWGRYDWMGVSPEVDSGTGLGGTAHITVVDAQGSAVAATSSINYYFGAGEVSPSTGIVWNNHMADFSYPAPGVPTYNVTNAWRAGQRPRSSMAPVVVLKNGKPLIASGASGGSKILSSVALVISRVLFLNETLKEATDAARFYNRLEDKKVQVEDGFPPASVVEPLCPLTGALEKLGQRLWERGHELGEWGGRSIVQSVLYADGSLNAQADYRKGGVPAGF